MVPTDIRCDGAMSELAHSLPARVGHKSSHLRYAARRAETRA
jgi:hypothetical protein